jgi:hypothetical protein
MTMTQEKSERTWIYCFSCSGIAVWFLYSWFQSGYWLWSALCSRSTPSQEKQKETIKIMKSSLEPFCIFVKGFLPFFAYSVWAISDFLWHS